MWQNWVNGILGLWVILTAFLGFPANVGRILLIITGLVIAVLSFWSAATCPKSKEPVVNGGGEIGQTANEN